MIRGANIQAKESSRGKNPTNAKALRQAGRVSLRTRR